VSTLGQTGTAVRADGLPGSGQTAGSGAIPPGQRLASPRRVRLSVSRVDPWTVMKMSFLLSVAAGIAGVVLLVVLWLALNSMGVFSSLTQTVESVLNTTSGPKFDLMNYIGLGRVLSLAVVIAVIDVLLITAISTLLAFLYNVCASLVGGLQVTLTDD
jgi:hypothetical protein